MIVFAVAVLIITALAVLELMHKWRLMLRMASMMSRELRKQARASIAAFDDLRLELRRWRSLRRTKSHPPSSSPAHLKSTSPEPERK